MSRSLFFLKVKDVVVRLFFKLLTIPFIPVNYYLIKKYGRHDKEFSPTFIIGAPRTGSTILYQGITNQFNVLYFDNLNTKFCHIPTIGFWLSEKLFKGRPHNCFNSMYGNTSGLNSPNEAGEFWIRFLPKNRHFIDYSDIESINTNRLKEELTALSNLFRKPIVFKNLNAGQRMRLLKKLFPNARFIFIKREPFYTAQSIIKSKRKQGIDDNEFWSIKPKNFRTLEKLEWPQQISEQIYYLEKQIHEDKQLFPIKNTYEISYVNLCSKSIEDIGKSLKLEERKCFKPLNLQIQERETLSSTEVDLLRQSIDSLNWQ